MAYRPRWLRAYRRKPRPLMFKVLARDRAAAVFDRMKRRLDGDD